jgi:endonuclease YncB( thermonuclease family)
VEILPSHLWITFRDSHKSTAFSGFRKLHPVPVFWQRFAVFSIGAGVLLAACTPAAAADSFSGYARAIDGDSLTVGDAEVRLFGIDAPEWTQTCKKGGASWACGEAAADQLSKLVTGKKLFCQRIDTDEYGRIVARCQAGSVDVNRTMVASGYATAYRHYSADYVPAEERAKAAKLGIWAGRFEMPSQYRHIDDAEQRPARRSSRRRAVAVQSARPSGACNIKGNRGSHGWIYHLPGMPYYEQTRAEEMFCSETEAQAAGYRRAIVK